MAAMGVNAVRTFTDFGGGPTATQILDELYTRGIMAIMTVDRSLADGNNITRTVNAYKNHPAILMWAIGNEWDLAYYDHQFASLEEAARFTEWAAQIVHGLDANHPVASVLADIVRGSYSAITVVNMLAPSVDVWGTNVYRGASLGGLFGEWKRISHKPMFVAEFGLDSYDHRTSMENQTMQAGIDSEMYREIFLHLSARAAEEPSVGGLVFEWNDEWWKNGNHCVHDTSDEVNYGQPDQHNDEEWFGVVDIYRQRFPMARSFSRPSLMRADCGLHFRPIRLRSSAWRRAMTQGSRAAIRLWRTWGASTSGKLAIGAGGS